MLIDSNRIIEQKLDNHLVELENELEADLLVYVGAITSPANDLIRDAIEFVKDRSKRRKLGVILETPGGYIEVAQRIADTFRHHYRIVEFIVPSYAMSAGTVLVMSGDAIYMDYYSVLGPIDPQVERPNSDKLVPALGYLAQYERLIKESQTRKLSNAEITYLVQNFNPAELYQFEQEKILSISLLQEWLVKYKFKNWKRTQRHRRVVTRQIKKDRAKEIADKLGDVDRWHSHSRGISMAVLKKDLNLRIDDFGSDKSLNSKIKSYYGLLKDYTARRDHGMIVLHVRGRYFGISFHHHYH